MVTSVRFDGPSNEPPVWDGLRVKLEGLSSDRDNLPTTVLNGSGFYEIDTGDYYMFDEENTTWRKQG